MENTYTETLKNQNYDAKENQSSNQSDTSTTAQVDLSTSKIDILGNIKSLLSRFKLEDLILFGLLFLLIEEGIEDDFLILIIFFLILTGDDN